MSYQPKTYREQGGDRFVVASSGSLDVESGGELDIESGGSLKIAGTAITATAAQLNSVATAKQIILNTEAKIGATAGWALGGGAANTGMMATCPQSQTASTLVVPVGGLQVGDTITGFSLNGQVDSAGGAVTLDADLRAMTAVSTGSTDASIGAITQVSVAADTLVSVANAVKTALTETVAVGKTYYVLLTATTAGTTDIELLNVIVNVTPA